VLVVNLLRCAAATHSDDSLGSKLLTSVCLL